jgi:hypothetical protein
MREVYGVLDAAQYGKGIEVHAQYKDQEWAAMKYSSSSSSGVMSKDTSSSSCGAGGESSGSGSGAGISHQHLPPLLREWLAEVRDVVKHEPADEHLSKVCKLVLKDMNCPS